MPAYVDTMFYVGETPWHQGGKKLNNPPDTETGIIEAGLDREIGLANVYRMDTGQQVPGKCTYYKDDNTVLSWVGPRWQPLQNRDMFKWFDPWVQSKEVSLHTAGSLHGGKRVWVLAEINNEKYPPTEIVKGDSFAKFILLSNPHVYGRSIFVGFTPIRVVCANTEAMAISDKSSKLIKIRHNRNTINNLEEVRETINLINREFETTAEKYRWLTSRKGICKSDLEKYYKIVLGKESVESKDLPKKTRNIMETWEHLFTDGLGQKNPEIAGSWYAAYNGISEWLNHQRGRSTDNRLESLWFGPSEQMNRKAFETALVLAA